MRLVFTLDLSIRKANMIRPVPKRSDGVKGGLQCPCFSLKAKRSSKRSTNVATFLSFLDEEISDCVVPESNFGISV